MGRVSKGVSFSEAEPFEMALWTHAKKQGKFASYVKRLIAEDMKGSAESKSVKVVKEAPIYEARSVDTDISSFV